MDYFGESVRMIVNNLMICYSYEGRNEAPAIIFIHGFPFNKSMWNTQVEALKDKYRVITYDIRGHGNSDTGDLVFSIDLFAKDLISFMDALKIDKAILCGLSMGGYIALNAIANYPERFDALILSDTQCTADTPVAKEKRIEAIQSIREEGVEKYADESIKNLFAAESFTSRKKEIAAVREMIVNTSEQSLCGTLNALSDRKETCHNLPEIKVPVLILVGKEDKLTPLEKARFMHEEIKLSSFNIIEHAGHISNMENPVEFNYLIREFLKNLDN